MIKTLQNLFLFILLASFNCQNSFADQKIFIVAKVNNQIITNLDLLDRYHLISSISKIKFNSSQEKKVVFNQLLNAVIEEELQIAEAGRLEIKLDQDKFDQALSKVAKSQGKNVGQLESSFKSKLISYQNFLKQLQSQILWSQIVNAVLTPKIKVSQAEIDELLEFRKIESSITKSFLSEIYIPFNYKNGDDEIDSKSLAIKLSSELKKGKDFKTLVKQFSRSATSEFDGEIGWVGEGDVDTKIYQAIAKLKTGNVSDPVLMGDGYYLFKISDQKTFSTLTNQDLEQIKNIIFNKKLQLSAKSYLMDLKKKAYIEINNNNLNSLIKDL